MSKFEQFLVEWNKEKEWDEGDDGKNGWSVVKPNPDGKGFKIVKRFKNHERKQADDYCKGCNKKGSGFKVMETA